MNNTLKLLYKIKYGKSELREDELVKLEMASSFVDGLSSGSGSAGVSFDDLDPKMQDLVKLHCREDLGISLDEFESAVGKKDVSADVSGDEVETSETSEAETGELEDESDELEDGDEEDSEDETEDEEDEETKANKQKIGSYYKMQITQAVTELEKQCKGMYESGYEVIKPAGILAVDGLIGLSGSERIVKQFNAPIVALYRYLQDRLGFEECVERSNFGIAERVYKEYVFGGKKQLFFPNKHLEFAYGRKKPSGDNQESLNTFPKHAESSNWSGYSKSEVVGSLTNVFESSVMKFVMVKQEEGEELFCVEMDNQVVDFISFLKKSLAFSLLMVNYKTSGSNDIDSFKLRVCDVSNILGQENLTLEILRVAFLGGTGVDAFSYQPRLDFETCVKEYAHEFNHVAAQGMPLFAYKAFEALKEQGMQLNIDNLILGKLEDDTILRNGKGSLNFTKNLTHFLIAGSRAGKGVMTLNILIAMIASDLPIFYFDRKPDMASVLKYLFPEMFVVNGAGVGAQYDTFNQFSDLDSVVDWGKVPNYLAEALGKAKSWDGFGDLFYMRALKLIIGIVMARANGGFRNEELGGEKGLCIVVDEFKVFQDSFALVVEGLLGIIPPSTYVKDKAKLDREDIKPEERAAFEVDFNKSYNQASEYAVGLLSSYCDDLNYINSIRDAGFAEEERNKTNIFVIGQSLDRGPMDGKLFASMIADNSLSGRYKSSGYNGISSTSTIKDKLGMNVASFPYSLVNAKTTDIFMGNNKDDGREVYLAQLDKRSKAFGRLDEVANNFCYFPSFSESMRKKIVSGNLSENVEMANRGLYFKPFLVLNDSHMDGACVQGMFTRCEKAHVSREEIIAENGDGMGDLNKAVGFEDYLAMTGISDPRSVMVKGSNIANNVVQRLGYNGNWFQFITDLSPEWVFTVEDIVDVYKGKEIGLGNISRNRCMGEFARFIGENVGVGENSEEGVEEEFTGGRYSDVPISAFGVTDFENDDYFDDDLMETSSNARMDGVMMDGMRLEDEINPFAEPVKEQNVNSVILGDGVDAVLESLRNMGYEITPPEDRGFEDEFESGDEVGEEFVGVEDEDDIWSTFNSHSVREGSEYVDIVSLVTQDVISKFGGLENIVSLKIIGGSLVVNGYYYQCRVDSSLRNRLSYDLRRELMSGNIARCFNYGAILRMPRLRDLHFDSVSFVYDYVSVACGWGSSVSVRNFFNGCSALQSLTLGKRNYSRRDLETLTADELDPFKRTRRIDTLSQSFEEVSKNGFRNSKDFTKRQFRNKDYGTCMKVLGVTVGVAGVALTGGALLGSKAFGGMRKLGRGLKDLWNEGKEI